MANSIGSVSMDFNANDKGLSAAFVGAQNNSDKLGASIKRLNSTTQKANTGFNSFVKTAKQLAVALGGLLVLKDIVNTYRDFEQAVTNAASVTGAFGDALAQTKGNITDVSKELGKTTVFAASEAANAFYDLASAGYDVANMTTDELRPVLDLAAATQSDLAFATETVTGALSSLGLGFDSSQRVADVFSKTIASSKATLDKLNQSYQLVGASLQSFNVDIEDANAALAVLFNRNIDGSRAGNILRNALNRTAAVTPQGTKVLQDYGIAIDDINVEARGLIPVLETLNDANISNADAIALFGQEYGAFTKVLIDNVGEMESLSGSLNDLGFAQKVAEEQLDTLGGSLKLLVSNVESLKLAIGEALAPVIREFGELLGGLASDQDFQEFLVALAKAFVGLVKSIVPIVSAIFDFSISVGRVLLPAIERLTSVASKLTPILTAMLTTFVSFKILTTVALWVKALSLALTQQSVLLGTSGLLRVLTNAIAAWGAYSVAQTGAITVTGLFSAAFRALTLALAANPIFAVALAIGAIVTAVVGAVKANRRFKQSFDSLTEAANEFSGATADRFVAALDRLREVQDSFDGSYSSEYFDNFKTAIADTEAEFTRLANATGASQEQIDAWLEGLNFATNKGREVAVERLGEIAAAFDDLSRKAISAFDDMNSELDGGLDPFLDTLEQWQSDIRETAEVQGLAADEIETRVSEMNAALREDFAEAGEYGKLFALDLSNGMTSAESIRSLQEAGYTVSAESIAAMAAEAQKSGDVGEAAALLYGAGIISQEQYVKFSAGEISAESLNAMIETNKQNAGQVATSFVSVLGNMFTEGTKTQQSADAVLSANADATGQNIPSNMAKGIDKKKGVFSRALGALSGAFNKIAGAFGVDILPEVSIGEIDFGGGVELDTFESFTDFGSALNAYEGAAGSAEQASNDLAAGLDGVGSSAGGGGKAVDEASEAYDELKDIIKSGVEDFEEGVESYADSFSKIADVDKEFIDDRIDYFKEANDALLEEGFDPSTVESLGNEFKSVLEAIDAEIVAGLKRTLDSSLGELEGAISRFDNADFTIDTANIFEIPDVNADAGGDEWLQFWEDYEGNIESVTERVQELLKEQAEFFDDLRKSTQDIKKELADLESSGGEDLAQELVRQEEKLADIRAEIADEQGQDDPDSDRIRALQEEASQIQSALNANKDLYETYADEIAEIKRRAAANELDLLREDLDKEKEILEERLLINQAFFEDAELSKPKDFAQAQADLTALKDQLKNEENVEFLEQLLQEQQKRQTELEQARIFLEESNAQREALEIQFQNRLDQLRAEELNAFQVHLATQEELLEAHKNAQVARYNAIAAAARAAASARSSGGSSSGGFASGGFTGVGNPSQVAGLVHKGEYVIPNPVLKKLRPTGMLGMLEGMRKGIRGFAEGGFTSPFAGGMQPQNKNVSVTINNNERERRTGITGGELLYLLRKHA